MTNIDLHYKKWIADCARDIKSGICPQGVLDHIIKHAVKDLERHKGEDVPNWRRWSSSMHNLMAIFDEIYLQGKPPSTEEKLVRLRSKYVGNQTTHTPEPQV